MLVRKTSKLDNIEGIAGDTHVGDLAQPETLAPALKGCDAVMHVAADYRLWIRDPDAMYRANVEARANCCGWRAKPGCRASSTRRAWPRCTSDRRHGDQRGHAGLSTDMVGHYKRSKFMAEQQAIAAAQDGQQVMILNPTTPIGPNDAKPTPTGRIFVDFLNRKFPAYVDTGLNLVDVAKSRARTSLPRRVARRAGATFWGARI